MHFNVLTGRSRPKDGVASLAYVPVIHVFLHCRQGVDARHKAGHDKKGNAFPPVIAGRSRPKDGVASLAYDPAIHDESQQEKSVLPAYMESHHGCAGQARA